MRVVSSVSVTSSGATIAGCRTAAWKAIARRNDVQADGVCAVFTKSLRPSRSTPYDKQPESCWSKTTNGSSDSMGSASSELVGSCRLLLEDAVVRQGGQSGLQTGPRQHVRM